MNSSLDPLLNRWREGTLTSAEMRELTDGLATHEGRAVLRRDWFLEVALPQALRTAPVLALAPKPARFRAWLSSWLPQDEAASAMALRMWAGGSLAALVLAGVTALSLKQTTQPATAQEADSIAIAQILFQQRFFEPDSP